MSASESSFRPILDNKVLEAYQEKWFYEVGAFSTIAVTRISLNSIMQILQHRPRCSPDLKMGSVILTRSKSALSGAFLLIIAVVFGAIFFMWSRESGKRQMPAKAVDEVTSKNATAPHVTKPSPAVPLNVQRSPNNLNSSAPASNAASPSTASWPPDGMQFTAHHKGHNGCEGVLILSVSNLQFTCPGNDAKSFSISINEIRGANDDGIVTISGAKYHFDKVPGGNKEYVARLLEDWLSRARLGQTRPQ